MFRTVPLCIISSFSLYTQQYIQVCWQLALSKPVWHIWLLCVQWKTTDDGQRNCPKHAEFYFFDVLLTVPLSIFISVFSQLDAQNFFHNKFYFMPLHVSSTCAHHQEVKIALHSDDTRGCVIQFWPPDDERMCSKHVEAWNKNYYKNNRYVHSYSAPSWCGQG